MNIIHFSVYLLVYTSVLIFGTSVNAYSKSVNKFSDKISQVSKLYSESLEKKGLDQELRMFDNNLKSVYGDSPYDLEANVSNKDGSIRSTSGGSSLQNNSLDYALTMSFTNRNAKKLDSAKLEVGYTGSQIDSELYDGNRNDTSVYAQVSVDLIRTGKHRNTYRIQQEYDQRLFDYRKKQTIFNISQGYLGFRTLVNNLFSLKCQEHYNIKAQEEIRKLYKMVKIGNEVNKVSHLQLLNVKNLQNSIQARLIDIKEQINNIRYSINDYKVKMAEKVENSFSWDICSVNEIQIMSYINQYNFNFNLKEDFKKSIIADELKLLSQDYIKAKDTAETAMVGSLRPYIQVSNYTTESSGIEGQDLTVGVNFSYPFPWKKQRYDRENIQYKKKAVSLTSKFKRRQYNNTLRGIQNRARYIKDRIKQALLSFKNLNETVDVLNIKRSLNQIDSFSITNTYLTRNTAINTILADLFKLDLLNYEFLLYKRTTNIKDL